LLSPVREFAAKDAITVDMLEAVGIEPEPDFGEP